jgi:PIN domain nuclease of toxin-antitoxin system
MSEMIVLDTHIWFWLMSQDFGRFPADWRDVIETAPQVGVSAICCYEITLAYQRGRLALPCAPAEWFQDALEPSGIMLLPITPEIACQATDLSPVHRDPFDRLIIATALAYDARLASVDRLFPQYPEIQNLLMR